MRAFLAGLFAFCLAAASAAASPPVSYSLRPVLKDGRLQAIAVTMGFAADPSGRTEIDLPDHHVGQSGLWKALHDIAVEGPQAELLRTRNPAVLIVRWPAGQNKNAF